MINIQRDFMRIFEHLYPTQRNAAKQSPSWHQYKPPCPPLSAPWCYLHVHSFDSQAANLKCPGFLKGRHVNFDVVPQGTVFVLKTQAWHISITHPSDSYDGFITHGFRFRLYPDYLHLQMKFNKFKLINDVNFHEFFSTIIGYKVNFCCNPVFSR